MKTRCVSCRRVVSGPRCIRLVTILSVCLVVLAITGLASATAGSCGLSNGGTLKYQVTKSSSKCGFEGYLPYTQWAFNTFVYVDPSGGNHSLGGSALYTYYSAGGSVQGCPPYGAVPDPLVLNGSGYQIDFTPEYAGEGSCTITE